MNHPDPRNVVDPVSSLPAVDLDTLQRRVRVAMGDEPGDLLLTGGRIVNVFTERVDPGNIIIADGSIAGVGPYDWHAPQTIALSGEVVLPGLIDAHMHLESTLLLPSEIAKLVVPRGTSAIVADPHEIANVLGVPGIELLIAASQSLPIDLLFMAPSCVPACAWESSGATLDTAAVADLLSHPRVLGLAEMMNFPGVVAADNAVLGKIQAALQRGAPIDGHAPGLTGRSLTAYAAAGIRSDHESTTVAEAIAKADLGMLVQVREGSSARNLDTLLPPLVENRLGDWCLATDDIHVDDLMDRGHIDSLLRRVVAAGVPPARAVRHATLVPARHYGLAARGAVAPGYRADLFIARDLVDFHPHITVKGGRIVAQGGEPRIEPVAADQSYANTVHLASIDESAFELVSAGDQCPVIGIVPNEIVTRRESQKVNVDSKTSRWRFDPHHDVALVSCIERHHGTGRVGLGLVRGFGFRRPGALGSSVAHDAHNLVIAGTNAADMLACTRALAEMGGGLVVSSAGAIKARLPLPVAGLVSDRDHRSVRSQLDEVTAAARNLGCPLDAPFGTLSFLSLSVIPELRITDRGLFDVTKQQIVSP